MDFSIWNYSECYNKLLDKKFIYDLQHMNTASEYGRMA